LLHETVSNDYSRLSFTNTADTNGPTGNSHEWTLSGRPFAQGSHANAQFNIFYGDTDGSGNGTDILKVFGDKRVEVDGTLTSTTPYCAFHAYNSLTDSNLNLGTNHTVDFDTERYDYGSNFSSDTFTAPKDGVYHLNTTIRLQHVSTDHPAYIRVGIMTSNRNYYWYEDTDQQGDNPGGHVAYWTKSFVADVDMDANDTAYIQIYFYGTVSSGNIDIVANQTFFSGHIIH